MSMVEVWLVEPYEAIVLDRAMRHGQQHRCWVPRARWARKGRRGSLRGCDEARRKPCDVERSRCTTRSAGQHRCGDARARAMGRGARALARVLLGLTRGGAGRKPSPIKQLDFFLKRLIRWASYICINLG